MKWRKKERKRERIFLTQHVQGVAFVLIFSIELTRFKLSLQTFLKRRFKAKTHRWEWLVSDRFVATASAFDNWSVDSGENFVNERRIGLKILLTYLLHRSMFVLFWHISIKLFHIDWSLFILERTYYVHKKLMGVMLHHWGKFLPYQILEPRRIQNLVIMTWRWKNIAQELSHLPWVFVGIR